MSLKDYSRKRKFARTTEPPPSLSDAQGTRFVVQRHHARRLHYDLRLEIGGVLKSWAVPQGPTLDPAVKRLAVQVEDHPIAYGDFEGTIPPGNYGAGTVTIWDTGSFEVLGDLSAEQQLERGDFKFQLHGRKLLGNFALVRIKKSSKSEWLLLKKPDFAAQSGWNSEDHLDPVHVVEADPSSVPGAAQAPIPKFIEPMLPTLERVIPEGTEWVYEIKWDGFRGLCHLDHGAFKITSRKGNSFDGQFHELREAAAAIRAKTAIVDAEIVVIGGDGRPSFSLLQQRTGFVSKKRNSTGAVKLIAFDLLYLNGYDLRAAALSDRQRLLRDVVAPNASISISEVFSGSGAEILQTAKQHGLEGIVAKRLDCKYEAGRSRGWIKIKFATEDEFVVCGFTAIRRKPFSSLVLGCYDGSSFRWAGNVGTGFNEQTLSEIHEVLKKLIVNKSPFSGNDVPEDEVSWVRPEVVASVRYSGWGGDHHLRAPVFVRLRPDLDVRDCVCDTVQPAQSPDRRKLLANSKSEQTIEIAGRSLKLTNLKKVFYPDEGFTKRDVIEYYHDVAPLLVPHLTGRPLSLKRYPNGISGEFFFQKDARRGLASWLRTEPIAESADASAKAFVICDDEPTLLYLANLGCIDHNPWLSRVDSLEHPDFAVLDLDPYHCAYDRIVEAAQLVRHITADLGLESYPKTTGGDGMHLYIPLEPVYTYEQVRTFSELIARLAIAERPDLFTTPRTVSQREKGKVYFDYLQIAWAKTISAPYVLRAYPAAPVATPLRWSEVKRGLSPSDFTLKNVRARFDRLGDIFAPVLQNPQRLERAMERMEDLVRSRHS